uniref:Cation-transporting P-type ATPase C-terminal domain-containing protein n=1 Tax=Acrobeloides nanus TaxID=290746 RepID=A0A914DN56_9BILA
MIALTIMKDVLISICLPIILAMALLYLLKDNVLRDRDIYGATMKFLQFHLSIGIVIVMLDVVGACVINDAVLKYIHIIWILFLDISLSLALAVDHSTKNPTALPVNSFIPRTIIKNIICHVLYQIIVLLAFLFVGERLLNIESGRWSPLDYPPSIHFTIIFNTFVMMTLFNGINCRMLNNGRNIFKDLFKIPPIFFIIWIVWFILQVLIVQLDGAFLWVVPLNLLQWGVCILLGLVELLLGQIIYC